MEGSYLPIGIGSYVTNAVFVSALHVCLAIGDAIVVVVLSVVNVLMDKCVSVQIVYKVHSIRSITAIVGGNLSDREK